MLQETELEETTNGSGNKDLESNKSDVKPEFELASRLDSLPFSIFHLRVVVALGITWILDGLEVTMVGIVAAKLTNPKTLGFTEVQVGWAATLYLLGAVIGALLFGYLADRFGRKRLYIATPLVYIVFSFATAFSFNFWSFVFCRFVTGMGIGGEYSSINSTIDELMPSRLRGRIDLYINGSYWLGAVLGSGVSLLFLDEDLMPAEYGWRISFLVGGLLGIFIVFTRWSLPESPRWLWNHGREKEALNVLADIERTCVKSPSEPASTSKSDEKKKKNKAPKYEMLRESEAGAAAPESEKQDSIPPPLTDDEEEQAPKKNPPENTNAQNLIEQPRKDSSTAKTNYEQAGFLTVLRVMVVTYPLRTLLGVVLMATQAFFYNSIFFSYPLVLSREYDVNDEVVGLYLIPFAITNFLGPVMLGGLFDSYGRRRMITLTYSLSGVLLIITSILYRLHLLLAWSQTACAAVIFFVASPAASAAYLTVGEIFPLQIRAMVIAIFYALGTSIGGLLGPVVFTWLLSKGQLFIGYLIAAALMILAGVVEWFLGIDAEGKALEQLAPPIEPTSTE